MVKETKFKISLDAPSEGWILFEAEFGDQKFTASVSHIYPILDDICNELMALLNNSIVSPVKMLAEPIEYQLCFLRDEKSKDVILEIHKWPDCKRSNLLQSNVIFTAKSDLQGIVKPFWRALRKCETSLPSAEFKKEWRGSFPSTQMQKLSDLLESNSQ